MREFKENISSRLLLTTVCIVLSVFLFADKFVNTYYIDYGVIGSQRSISPKCIDINRNGIDDLILHYTNMDTSFVRIYEYTEDSFVLMQEIKDTGIFSANGVGDFDSDGLYEILLFYGSESVVALIEQPDSFSYPDSITWKSDTIWECSSFLGGTNKFTKDSTDIIYGNGNPLISTPTLSKGWYYMTCTGDNQYELQNTYVPDTIGPNAMDVGDVDNDTYCDVMIVMHGNLLNFEAQDTLADSFAIKWRWSTQANLTSVPDGLLIYPDIDQDGKQEIGFFTLAYLSPQHSYHYYLIEDTIGTGKIKIIWEDSILVDYDNMFVFASNMTYGDIDGDSLDELVICGGRTVRAYDILGNDSIVTLWEWTCPTNDMIQSHVTCHDFNKNGYDEIIFAGSGDSYFEYATYIFEDSVVAFIDTTGIVENSHSEFNSESDISIRNNTIYYTINKPNSSIIITDILGRVLYSDESIEPGDYEFKANGLKNGVYFIKLQDNHTTITKKYLNIK